MFNSLGDALAWIVRTYSGKPARPYGSGYQPTVPAASSARTGDR